MLWRRQRCDNQSSMQSDPTYEPKRSWPTPNWQRSCRAAPPRSRCEPTNDYEECGAAAAVMALVVANTTCRSIPLPAYHAPFQ
jgi:hypothetical protein